MHSDIPLDDRIGQTYYVGGSLWRYLYNASIHRFALRRTVTNVPIDLATELIASVSADPGGIAGMLLDRLRWLTGDAGAESRLRAAAQAFAAPGLTAHAHAAVAR